MKRKLQIVLALAVVALIGAGCSNMESKQYYSSVVTLIDGTWSYAYSAEFDNVYLDQPTGKTAYITNSNRYPFTFSEKLNGEGRAQIWYEVDEASSMEGFDHVISLVAHPEPISTFNLVSIKDPEVTELDKYTAPAHVTQMTYSFNTNYLTVVFAIPASQTGNYSHKLQLLYNDNPEHEGAYQEYYPATDDGYLYLELYHDSNGDIGTTLANPMACYKVDRGALRLNYMDTYKGIKVIQPAETGRVEIFTYDFPKVGK